MTKFTQKSFSVFVSDYRPSGLNKYCPKCGAEGMLLGGKAGRREKLVCLRPRCNVTWYRRAAQ